MPGVRGKPVLPHVRAFIVSTARKDPTSTNSDLVRLVEKEFGDAPDLSTVGRIRKNAGITNSREAAATAAARIGISQEQRDYVLELLEKIKLPHPDDLIFDALIVEAGVGTIGSRGAKIFVRLDGVQLLECWLTARELKFLSGVGAVTGKSGELMALLERGKSLVREVVGHNMRVDQGTGEPTFFEVTQEIDMGRHELLAFDAKQVWDLWHRYSSFGRDLENFKRTLAEDLNPLLTAS